MVAAEEDPSGKQQHHEEEERVRNNIPTTQELVAQQLAKARAKKQARQRSLQRTRERHAQLQARIAAQGLEQATGHLYAVKVTVCNTLRQRLPLSGREKRGRLFVEPDSDAVQSIRALKQQVHTFFRALPKDAYVLQGAYPALDNNDNTTTKCWNISSDEDVQYTFQAANDFFANHSDALKRPSIVLHVNANPKAPPPPAPPAYLVDMPNPADTPSMTMLSFYAFPAAGIADPVEFAEQLEKLWKPFGALGRVYVATEGVNAQMAVPTNVLSHFRACCDALPALQSMENGLNIDPVPLSLAEFAVAGAPQTGDATTSHSPPFKSLHIRVRHQVVADGLDQPLNWQSAGYDMPPLEWHAALQKRLNKADTAAEQPQQQPQPILLDCRNTYETDVGSFEGAEPVGTETFKETWDALQTRLADTPKDAPIMTYCTGGIRCVKVGAYLTQKMGFTNVSRLAGGIVAYDRTLQQQAQQKEQELAGSNNMTTTTTSLFKGTNFVFDGRLGRAITTDAMGICVTCRAETSLVSNCANGNCHKRIIQCENCRTSFQGTCSAACRHRLVHGSSTKRFGDSLVLPNNDLFSSDDQPRAVEPLPQQQQQYASLEDYSVGHSTPPPSLYKELEFNTQALIPSGSHMVSGPAQGRLLQQLAALTRHGRILEVGTFTGYGTACLLEGAVRAAQVLGAQAASADDGTGPYVMSMERDVKAFQVAAAQLQIVAQFGFDNAAAAAEALCALRSRRAAADPVPTDERGVVSLECSSGGVTCDLVHVSDALATLEEMAAGKGPLVNAAAPFDLVFVDADKTRLIEYANACLSSDRLLHRGGLIVVDNVLWKGLVLDVGNNQQQNGSASATFDDEPDSDDEGGLSGGTSSVVLEEDVEEHRQVRRKNRRARKLANKMHRFNTAIAQDSRAEVLVLPFRDGLSIIRKK